MEGAPRTDYATSKKPDMKEGGTAEEWTYEEFRYSASATRREDGHEFRTTEWMDAWLLHYVPPLTADEVSRPLG